MTSMGEGRGVYRGLVGRPDRKRLLGRHRRKCNDNIKMGDQEVRQKARVGTGGKR